MIQLIQSWKDLELNDVVLSWQIRDVINWQENLRRILTFIRRFGARSQSCQSGARSLGKARLAQER